MSHVFEITTRASPASAIHAKALRQSDAFSTSPSNMPLHTDCGLRPDVVTMRREVEIKRGQIAIVAYAKEAHNCLLALARLSRSNLNSLRYRMKQRCPCQRRINAPPQWDARDVDLRRPTYAAPRDSTRSHA